MPATDTKPVNHSIILSELAGSVGNFGTVLPLLFAVSVASGMDIAIMLVWAAFWYIISGLYYRIPIPIEPLKAVGAIAIADHLAPTLIAASGILMGIICLIIGFFGWMGKVRKIIPEPVIRGVQLGLALIFIKSAITGFILPDLMFAGICAAIVILFFCAHHFRSLPDLSALVIIIGGFLYAILQTGMPSLISLPFPHLVLPSSDEYLKATIILLPPQLPLTLTNAILATSLLITDLFKTEQNPDRLSKTVGMMSLSSSLFGGFPMCHGAGGLAAHYRFGGRTGLSLVIGGIFLLLMAILCTDGDLVTALPMGMFGILLVAVAIELIKHGLKTNNYVVTGIIALLAVPFGLAISFFAGLVLAWIIAWRKKSFLLRQED